MTVDNRSILPHRDFVMRLIDAIGYVRVVPVGQKWVFGFAGGEISKVVPPGPFILRPGDVRLAIVPIDVFPINPDVVEFDMLQRQPLEGEEEKRIPVNIDMQALAHIHNAGIAVEKFASHIAPDRENPVLSTEGIAKEVMELVVSTLKEFVLAYDYKSIVSSEDRRGFDSNDLLNRMNRVFAKFGIKFDSCTVSDPGSTEAYKRAMQAAAIAEEEARAKLIDAESDRRAAEERARGMAASLDAILEWAARAAADERITPQMQSQLLRLAGLMHAVSEDRGEGQRPFVSFGMGEGSGDSSTFVLMEMRQLREQIARLVDSLSKV